MTLTCVMRVLLIENDPHFRLLLKRNLQSMGCEVLEAEDGLAGCELAEVVVPEVILLALDIPKLHGFEVLKRLRAKTQTKAIPIIALPALQDARAMRECLDLGAHRCIVKGSRTPLQIARQCISVVFGKGEKSRGSGDKSNWLTRLKGLFSSGEKWLGTGPRFRSFYP